MKTGMLIISFARKITGILDGGPVIAFEIISRLKRYENNSRSYRLDVRSIPTAMRMVLRLFPRKYRQNSPLKEEILRAFVCTIIPDADASEENLAKMYVDMYYPFHMFSGYFVFDLNMRSRELYGHREFVDLSPEERTSVVQNALTDREITRRLYKGAILMAHVSYYGAIYNEMRGCPLIDFPGQNEGYEREDSTYSFSNDLFDRELSFDGQPW